MLYMAFMTLGVAMAATTMMTAITTSSSIKEKPLCLLLMFAFSGAVGTRLRAFSLSGGEIEGDITTVLQASRVPFVSGFCMSMKTQGWGRNRREEARRAVPCR